MIDADLTHKTRSTEPEIIEKDLESLSADCGYMFGAFLTELPQEEEEI